MFNEGGVIKLYTSAQANVMLGGMCCDGDRGDMCRGAVQRGTVKTMGLR